MRAASRAQQGLLVVRAFFGATFLYAGLDKLIDPAFLDPNSAASIEAQLTAFARASPIALLVRPAEPFAVPIGILIALAEIAIGIGALTGLAFRVAAVGGAALSILFWLTASWTTVPYYYGPDLPYAVGWIALAIAGHGDLLVPGRVLALGRPGSPDTRHQTRSAPSSRHSMHRGAPEGISAERRLFLQAGVLGAAALLVGSLTVPFRVASEAVTAERDDEAAGGESGSSVPGDEGGTSPGGSPVSSVSGLGGLAIARTSDVDTAGAKTFHIPATAPAAMQPGDPGIVVRLADGSYVAYDATCTHAGCRVDWDTADNILLCPCHGAAFDAANHGAVLGGPTNTPLLELPIAVDAASGTIALRA